MHLNIKNREVYHLASELAQQTGQSMTTVVLNALRRESEEIERKRQKETRVQELMAIGRRCAAHIRQPVTAVGHDDILYDEHGMPQ